MLDFLKPLLEAANPIPLHAFAAIAALVIGAAQLFRKKGGVGHRLLGRVWVSLMAGVALSSFFIWELRVVGQYSPIHLLSVFTLGALVVSILAARKGNIKRHRQSMKAMYFLALVLTGLFTLLPGRVMYEVFAGLF